MIKPSSNVARLTQMALLAAISIVMIIFIRIIFFPVAPFLVYDIADVPILLGAFLLGPAAGMIVLFVVCFVQAFPLGGSGIFGFIMHFVASGTLILVASYIWKLFKCNTRGMIIGLAAGTVAMIAITIPLNLVVMPLYGAPIQVVKEWMIPVIIPFNLIKAGLNSVIFFFVYQSLKRILK